MTREQAKENMLHAFNENVMGCETLTSFVAGFPDEYTPFENELYDMVRELASEGELVIFKFTVPEDYTFDGNPVEVLFPKGSRLSLAD